MRTHCPLTTAAAFFLSAHGTTHQMPELAKPEAHRDDHRAEIPARPWPRKPVLTAANDSEAVAAHRAGRRRDVPRGDLHWAPMAR